MKSPELDALKTIIQVLSPLEIQVRRQVLETSNLIIEAMEKLVNSSQRKPKFPPADMLALSDDEPNKLLSTKEAAAMFGVSPATIHNWHQAGHITGIPKGKDNRSGLVFKKAGLVAFGRIHKKHSKLAKKTKSTKKSAKKTTTREAAHEPIKEGLLDTTEAAKLLGVSTWTIRNWKKDGLVTAAQTGRPLRFDKEALMAYKASKASGTNGVARA